MKKRLVLIVPSVAAVAAVLLSRGSGAPQASPPPPPVTILLSLGEQASALERWDGSVRVTGGTLLRMEGRHFSEGDSIAPPAAWRAATRRDEVAPYADVHYTEIRPGARPEVRYHAVGIYVTVQPAGEARIAVETAQGAFAVDALAAGPVPQAFLDGRATAQLVPTSEKLSDSRYEDDEPSIAALPGGEVAVAWVAYRDRADRILLRIRRNGTWSAAEEVTPKPADIWRSSLAAAPDGTLWAFWSQREGEQWHIWSRRRSAGSWSAPERLTAAGTNSFHRAAAGGGSIFVAYQSFRGRQSDIYLREYRNGNWRPEVKLSESSANDWEPAIAATADGTAYVAWDSYDRGDYDIFFRTYRDGTLSPASALTSGPNFQAHAAVAVDARNRPWIAWNESGVNWGKDQGFLIPTPLSVPLHQQRWIRLAVREGTEWREPAVTPASAFPERMRRNAEHPQIAFDGQGTLLLLFRHWTRRNDRTIGSPITWGNYLTRFDGEHWQPPQPVADSAGSIEKHPALARDSSGEVWAAWMTDGRPFSTQIPVEGDIWCARLGPSQPARWPASGLTAFREDQIEAIRVHSNETRDVAAVRAYSLSSNGVDYKIYRGDMHRHTDVSQDFKYDGSLLEVYRYALDAAGFDYILPTDHQAGYDQEFTWWQNQKLVDLFQVPGAFTPLYGYERSLNYPNGHRNVVFDHRGVRTLPVPPEERDAKTGAARLYAYLKENGGISMPHSSATDQGTDWRDNDPEVEPLVEIFQGYRNSYEYEGAPRSATELNPQAQKSGWRPAGFWWNALTKGYKLGVQSSSDHWSTHISYACIVARDFTRAGLLDAIRRRHAYAATDNIVLDFRARARGREYIMGDAFAADSAPQFILKTQGTGAIQQIDLIKDRRFLYTTRPGTREMSFEFTDRETPAPGSESWYYVRVLQENGQLAWSSPIWVKRQDR